MCFRTCPSEVDVATVKRAEAFIESRSVKELISIYPDAVRQLGRSFTRGELECAILLTYEPEEVVQQYIYALIAGGGKVLS